MASEMFAFEAVSSMVGIAGMAGAIGGIPLPRIQTIKTSCRLPFRERSYRPSGHFRQLRFQLWGMY
jgi:hypothetical protein